LKNQFPAHSDNGDDSLYPNRAGSHTKALPHNALGDVDPAAYQALLQALATGRQEDFAAIPLGGTVKLGNPQSAYMFAIQGPDSHQLSLPLPPSFAGAWEAGEMAEIYWQALTRDVAFADYETDPTVGAAATELSSYSDFRGPRSAGVVTPRTLFRGPTPGDLSGPYVSQFLYKNVPFGPVVLGQKLPVPISGSDFLTSYPAWLAIQNGIPAAPVPPGGAPRYIINNRDLAEWVHKDLPFQAGAYAAQILSSFGVAALAAGNPYKTNPNQGGFVTFGAPHILAKVAQVTAEALKAVWFQKWLVHRRLRPEEFGGRVHNHLMGAANYPIHPELLAKTAAGGVLDRVFFSNAVKNGGVGSYLLSQSYPEGSPPFSAYPSGHAAFAGACVTVLKAFFDESFVIPSPVMPDATGQNLVPYVAPSGEPALTVGGELNKLAFNLGMGRDAAGIHWRSDIEEGNKLGEAVAIGVLSDEKDCFNEPFGFSFTKFDGSTVTI
jgi:membrane-associated phospholipid phosphatase